VNLITNGIARPHSFKVLAKSCYHGLYCNGTYNLSAFWPQCPYSYNLSKGVLWQGKGFFWVYSLKFICLATKAIGAPFMPGTLKENGLGSRFYIPPFKAHVRNNIGNNIPVIVVSPFWVMKSGINIMCPVLARS